MSRAIFYLMSSAVAYLFQRTRPNDVRSLIVPTTQCIIQRFGREWEQTEFELRFDKEGIHATRIVA
jgi:hypothetical protein